MQTRIYVVSNTKTPKPARLIEASSQSQAMRHVAQDEYCCEVASPKDVAHLMSTGVRIESAQPPVAQTEAAEVGVDQEAM